MSNKIVYRKEKGFQLTSNEVDGNFKYLDERIDKVAEKDYFVFDAGYSKSVNVVTVNAGSKWRIKGNEIGNDVPFSFAIDSTSVGCYRVDVVYANDKGQFEIATGVENTDGYVVGRVEQLQYVLVYVSDQGIQSVGDSNSDFVSKLSFGWVQQIMQYGFVSISDQVRNIDVIGGNQYEGNIANPLSKIDFKRELYDGIEISIRNSRTDYMTIRHNISNIFLYTLKDYYLRPGEIIVFKYVKSEDKFYVHGALDIPLTLDNVDEIIGVDSLALFIDSSEGDFIDSMNMRTTLTATVERYFKDFTHQVVQWQWFRESGTTKEDQDSDAIWSLGKNKRIIELTQEDFTQNIYDHSITFMCQAIVEGQTLTAKMNVG
ncbi:MAG: hypothetical protein LBE34_13930 [Flavobacteriaceae bacterium]|jgi:hypothetical protein|nr:hypothetical protein [Flavobacteriaceae bacterium]